MGRLAKSRVAHHLQTPGTESCPGREPLPMLDNTFLALSTQLAGKGAPEVVAAALETDCKAIMISCRPADMNASHNHPAQVLQIGDDSVVAPLPSLVRR